MYEVKSRVRRPHILRGSVVRRLVALLVSAFIAALCPAMASADTPCEGAGGTLEQLGAGAASAATLCLLNREREAHGLPALRVSARLARAAQRHSDDMVARRYFAHGNYGARIARTGWTRHRRSYTIGENLAYATGAEATPGAVVAAWMASAGHRANILQRRFRAIGIGIAAGTPDGEAGATYSTDFGS
jgi:uncharacterized protein YkwD